MKSRVLKHLGEGCPWGATSCSTTVKNLDFNQPIVVSTCCSDGKVAGPGSNRGRHGARTIVASPVTTP